MTLFSRYGIMAVGAAMAIPLTLQAAAPDRLAVVIGNQDYATISDLGNARNDATAMAGMLRDMGFRVFEAHDLDRRGFEEVLRKSVLNTTDQTEIVFFYAGHGIQIGRRNYLLPTDVTFDSVYDLPVESVTLDRVIDLLSARGHVHVAIIDACRDNPFPDAKLAGTLDASLFETKSGFDVFQTPLNSLVAFSTSPGQVAQDGDGQVNSPYTSAILTTVLEAPQEDVTALFPRVRERVYQATSGAQVPWESSTLVTPFRFLPAATRSVELVTPADLQDSGADTVTADTATRASTVSDLPAEITLSVEYDRQVPVSADISRALGLTGEMPVAIETQPESGTLSVDDGGLVYVPTLSERRSDTRALNLEDAFTLRIGAENAAQSVRVSLDMAVNACDLAAGDALDAGGVGFYRLPNEIEVAHALTACREAVAGAPETARFRYQLGRAEQAAGRFEQSFASYEAAIEAGHIRALNAAARLLTAEQVDRDLVDIPLDRERADALLERGIAAGDPFAIHSRGLHLLRRGETPQAREEGFDLLDRAAELGHTYSMNELGVYFLNRDGPHFLPERGMRYLEASAARDDIYGWNNLGLVALYGLEDGTVDHAAAYDWFRRAALGGHPRAPASIGRMVVRGEVPGQGPEAAVEWYDMGLARGDGWGGANGAFLILDGQVPGRSAPEALIRAAKATHLPDADAAVEAMGHLDRASARDLSRAVQMLLNDLGEALAVDGAIGPATRGVLESRAAAEGLPAPANDPKAQLLTAAKLYWAQNPTRPDLF